MHRTAVGAVDKLSLVGHSHNAVSACDPSAIQGSYLHRADDVRYKFERYGFIRDIYLPKDHHSGCARLLWQPRDQARVPAKACQYKS